MKIHKVYHYCWKKKKSWTFFVPQPSALSLQGTFKTDTFHLGKGHLFSLHKTCCRGSNCSQLVLFPVFAVLDHHVSEISNKVRFTCISEKKEIMWQTLDSSSVRSSGSFTIYMWFTCHDTKFRYFRILLSFSWVLIAKIKQTKSFQEKNELGAMWHDNSNYGLKNDGGMVGIKTI